MPKFAANLSLLFAERPYEERFAAAAQAGFSAVEVLFPYAEADATIAGLQANELELILINAPLPDAETGQLGMAATPGAEARFRGQMEDLLKTAQRLQPDLVHVMSGNGAGPEALETFVANLRWLADAAPWMRFTVEPLNPRDRPDYFMNSYDLAAEVLDRVAHDRVGLQYDTYHSALIEGDALDVWRRHRHRAFHVQIGNPPDRSEPAPGEVDFAGFFGELDDSGYDGWVSAEYVPSRRTEDTLGWMKA